MYCQSGRTINTLLVLVKTAAVHTDLQPWGKEIAETLSSGGVKLCIGSIFRFLRTLNLGYHGISTAKFLKLVCYGLV